MVKVRYSSRFNKDWKKVRRSGKNLDPFKKVINLLISGTELPPIYDNHPLKGDRSGHWSCHPQEEMVLIYKRYESEIVLERIGKHAEIYE